VEVQDGRAITLHADRDHPFTAGGLCTKVNRFTEDRVYHPDRITTPLRRTGPKGAAAFEPISWEDALDEVAERLESIVSSHGGEAVLPFSFLGTQGLVQGGVVSDAFFARVGATSLEREVCGATGLAGLGVTMGGGPGLPPEQLEHASLILLWGTNTLSTNLHLWPFLRRARDAGATLVAVDPVATRTVKACDQHVQPRPGTDAALALGMLHVIVAEGLHDVSYVEEHTVGFEQLTERLQDYSPEQVSSVTGLEASVVVDLARLYATSRPAAIRLLVGMEHRQHGADAYRAIACLPAVTGAWRDQGGGLAHMTFQLFDELDWSCGVDVVNPPTRSVNMVQLGRALTELDPPVRALVCYNANPAVTTPDQNRVLAGLAREDLFSVVLEHVLTDTAAYADIVLPATTQVEHDDVVWSWGHTYLTWNQAAIDPVGQARSNAAIFRELGRRMGFTDPVFSSTDRQLADAAVAPLGPDRVATLTRQGWLRVDRPEHQTPYAHGSFATPSGKAELWSASEAAAGRDPLPGYRPADESPRSADDRFPLSLVTAKTAHHFLNSSYAHVDRAVKAEREPMVTMHEQDAAARGVRDGARVRVFNQRGAVEVAARVGADVPVGCVSLPSGWWASRSAGGRSANALTADGVARGGGGDFHDTLVEVEALDVSG
jgi:anaerobic selenocysteine-containing dehydrogenase